MKKKPDVSGFEGLKDPMSFIDAAVAESGNKPSQTSAPTNSPSSSASSLTTLTTHAKPEPTVQKIFRIRWDISKALKIYVAEQSAITGKRVTEAEVVENQLEILLAEYLNR